jgi:hypothetical protein
MSEQRLLNEIQEVLKEVNAEQLKSSSPLLLKLANALAEKDQNKILGKLTAAWIGGCKSQHVEALLRLYESNVWIGASPNKPYNVAMLFDFCVMANGIYNKPGSFRENFEALAIANMALVFI